MNRKTSLSPLALGAALAVAGCSPMSEYHTVEFKVTLDGQPVNWAIVTMIPINANSHSSATCLTDGHGEGKVSSLGMPGALRGSYKVIIKKQKGFDTKRPEEDKELPAKYGMAETTPFDVTVPVNGQQTLAMESGKSAN